MGSIHRIGLAIAALATTVTVAAVFVIQGYVEARNPATASPVVAAAPAGGSTVSPDPTIVYVNPAPSPSVISVEQTAPPAAQPPVLHVIIPGPGGDDDGGGLDN